MIKNEKFVFDNDILSAMDVVKYYEKYHHDMIHQAKGFEHGTIMTIISHGDADMFMDVFRTRINEIISNAFLPYDDAITKANIPDKTFEEFFEDTFDAVKALIDDKFKNGFIQHENVFDDIYEKIHIHVETMFKINRII